MKFLMSPVILMLEKLIRVVGCLWYNDYFPYFLFSLSIFSFFFFSFHCVLNRNKRGFFRLSLLFKFSSLPLRTSPVIINPLQQLNCSVMVQQRCTNIFWVINDCWNAITNQHCCYAYFTTFWICCWGFFYLITLRIHLLQSGGGMLHIKRCLLSFFFSPFMLRIS